jgi:pentatricopeptide repeat protein
MIGHALSIAYSVHGKRPYVVKAHLCIATRIAVSTVCTAGFKPCFTHAGLQTQAASKQRPSERVGQLQHILCTSCDSKHGFALALHAVRGLADQGHALTSVDYVQLLRHAVLVLRSGPAGYAIWDVARRSGCCITSDMLHFRVLASLRDDDPQDALDVIRSCQMESVCRVSDETAAMVVKALLQKRHNVMLNEALNLLSNLTRSHTDQGSMNARRALLELCIEAYVQVRRPKDALALFSLLEQQGIQPSIFGYNGALHAWSQLSHRTAIKTHSALIGPDGTIAASDELSAAACANVAGIFRAMSTNHVAPNEVSFNHYLQVLCDAGQLEEAATIPRQMIESGFTPQGQTFTTLISALVDLGKLTAARDAFLAMKACGVPVNVSCAGALVKALTCISTPFQTSSGLVLFGLQELHAADLAPSDILLNSLIRGFILRNHLSTASEFVESLPLHVGESTWRCIFHALLDRGLLEEAWNTFR